MARRSGADRRQQIVGAATEAILERGVALAATRDVTKAIGVGSGLLHHYFTSWAELRAEAVGQALGQEITQLEGLLTGIAPDAALHRVVDWMLDDDDMRHWRLWLNAQDEAHRDDLLAGVMNAILRDWHRLISDLLARAAAGRGATRLDTQAAAWRLAALMDGLAGALLVRGSAMTPELARTLMLSQIDLEFGGG